MAKTTSKGLKADLEAIEAALEETTTTLNQLADRRAEIKQRARELRYGGGTEAAVTQLEQTRTNGNAILTPRTAG